MKPSLVSCSQVSEQASLDPLQQYRFESQVLISKIGSRTYSTVSIKRRGHLDWLNNLSLLLAVALLAGCFIYGSYP